MEQNWQSKKSGLKKKRVSRALFFSQLSKLKKILLLFLGLSLVFATADFMQVRFVQEARLKLMDVSITAIESLMLPYNTAKKYAENTQDFFQGFEKINSLKAENVQLRGLLQTYGGVMHENFQLKKMIDAQSALGPQTGPKDIILRVLTFPGKPYLRNILLKGGARIGVQKNQPLRSPDGLVGRVVNVSADATHGLLLTDVNARVPIVLSNGMQHGVLVGDNSAFPVIEYVKPTQMRIGQVVETSGKGGIFPVGIPVGLVHSIDDGVVRLKPFADLDHLIYVQAVPIPEMPSGTVSTGPA